MSFSIHFKALLVYIIPSCSKHVPEEHLHVEVHVMMQAPYKYCAER